MAGIRRQVWRAVGSAAWGVALAHAAQAEFQDLEGRVLYREKIALPPEALVEVTLEDVSKMDVAATHLASQTLRPEGQMPVQFALRYDDRMVMAQGRYAVRAVIRVGDEVLWRSTEHVAALTQGAAEQVDVVVQRMGGAVDWQEVEWQVVRIGGADIPTERLPMTRFGAQGQVGGTSGCNRFSGSYTEDKGALAFGNLAVTRMACQGALGAQEQQFFEALSRVTRIDLSGSAPILRDSAGGEVMRLAAP